MTTKRKAPTKARKSTASSGKNSGTDKRAQNKGRVENLSSWQPGQSGNPKGRPKSHDELRELIQTIAAAQVKGTDLTQLELMVQGMFLSGDSRDRQNVLEHGWGKVTLAVAVRSWRDDVIDLLKQNVVTPAQVIDELGHDIASELFDAAGIRRDETGQTQSARRARARTARRSTGAPDGDGG